MMRSAWWRRTTRIDYAQVYKHHAVSKLLREAALAEARTEALASVSASTRALADASRSARAEVMASIEEVARRARAKGSFSSGNSPV